VAAIRIEERMKYEGDAQARFDLERLEFHRAVRRAYLELAEEEPRRFCIVDASQSVERMQERILGELKEMLS
jgi:dTMP kinase